MSLSGYSWVKRIGRQKNRDKLETAKYRQQHLKDLLAWSKWMALAASLTKVNVCTIQTVSATQKFNTNYIHWALSIKDVLFSWTITF